MLFAALLFVSGLALSVSALNVEGMPVIVPLWSFIGAAFCAATLEEEEQPDVWFITIGAASQLAGAAIGWHQAHSFDYAAKFFFSWPLSCMVTYFLLRQIWVRSPKETTPGDA